MPTYDPTLLGVPTKRGERNNNPTNLDRGNPRIGWNGEEADQSGDTRFSIFKTVEYGIRAALVNMRTHNRRDKDGKFRVSELVTIWAPPIENETAVYIKFVRDRLQAAGFYRGEVDPALDLTNRSMVLALFKAIITKECGRNIYPDALILRGMDLAGGWRSGS